MGNRASNLVSNSKDNLTYEVSSGNWTNNVRNRLGNNPVGNLVYDIRTNSDSPDPAEGCLKNFSATYKCGDYEPVKQLDYPKDATGGVVNFNCSTEFAKCTDLKLTLTDDAKLTLSNSDGKKVFWDSVTAFGASGSIPLTSIIPADSTGTIPANAPLTVPAYAGNGLPSSNYDVPAGGGPGRRYPFNYLLSGQFLERGQWIGSPSGTCRLVMGTRDAPNSLQVVKSILGCDSLDSDKTGSTQDTGEVIDLGCWNDTGNRAISGPPQQYGYTVETCKQYALNNGSDIFALQHGGWCTINKPDDNYRKYGAATGSCPTLGGGWVNHVYKINKKTDIDIDTQASRLYSINNTIHNEHIGKVGYVNHMGQLHLYPDTTMTTYNDSFEQIGSYNISSGSEIGTATNASTVSDCQEKCVSNGDTQKCAGFVFDTTTAMCQLLNNTMVTKNRIIDGKKQYYIREKGVKNQDISCPLDVNITNAKFWNDTVINPTNMTSTTKCGLAKYTENERAAVANKLPNVYDNIQYKDPNNNVSDAKYRDLSGNEPLLNKNKNGCFILALSLSSLFLE